MYVNSINFFGSAINFDAESEYRLALVASSIIEAKRKGNDLSTQVKSSLQASVLGERVACSLQLDSAIVRASDARKAWARLSLELAETRAWHTGKLRPEFAEACQQAANDAELHPGLVEAGLSRSYMKWGFDRVRDTINAGATAEAGVLAVFTWLAEQAQKIADSTATFIEALEVVRSSETPSIYRHLYDTLGVGTCKPDLHNIDEAAFAAVCDFDLVYEAFEQVTRQAHLLIPGTHAGFNTFDTKFRQ